MQPTGFCLTSCLNSAGRIVQLAPRRPHCSLRYTESWSSFRTSPSYIASTAGPATACAKCCPAPGRATPISGRSKTSISKSKRAQVLSLVGPNGCGKSTLLQIVSGILQPTTGRVVTRGRIAALLELGAGFNPEFSGRENVYLNAEIMGLSRAEIDRAMPSIEAFAEIGEFIERPVKEYSSGMYVRLAFSTAIHVEPEILIVDEALAVGDAVFANRCVRKFEELRARKITVLFVSHDLGLVKSALRPRHPAAQRPHRRPGRAQRRDQPLHRPGAGTAAGARAQGRPRARQFPPRRRHQRNPQRGNPQRARRTGRLASHPASPSPSACARASTPTPADPMVGILLRTRIGMDVYGTNTRIEQIPLGNLKAGDELEVDFKLECWLTPQQYTLTVATQGPDGSSHDWLDDTIAFEVVDTRVAAGVANLRAQIAWRVSP